MKTALNLLALLFALLAAASLYEAVTAIAAFHAARGSAPVDRAQFVMFAVQMTFSWLFVSVYVALAYAFFRRRRLHVTLLFLVLLVACSWFGTIYHRNGIILAVVGLGVLTAPRARAMFRD